MNFLYCGDMHESIVAPENRKDDFRETVNNKIAEIRQLGKDNKISALLEGGDFLNAPKYDYKFLAEVLQRWTPLDMNELMLMIMSGKFTADKIAERIKDVAPIIGVVGNHELFGTSLASLPKTSINFLSEMGLIQFATKENPIFFTTDDGLKIAITGTHYHVNMDKPEYVDDYIVKEKLGDVHIHIVHGLLTNKNFGTLFRHTTVDKIAKETKADITITGHDHIGFDLMEIDGKYFVNPGSPIRLKNDLKEMKRKPKVLLISITKKDGIKIKNIYLKSALDGELVLDRTKIINKQEQNDKINKIKSMVQKASLRKGADITEIIANISENKNLPIAWRDELVEAVLQKMKEMNPDTHNFEDYYITRTVLENFQSHGYTDIECSPKLNIFVGESRQGKTSILRAFSWIYEDGFKNSRRLIKKGADFAKATIYLSNGYIITRVIERKKSGKNGYEIYNPHTGNTEYNNTKILSEVQEILGFTTLNIGTAKPVALNFLKQGKSWFFIGDDITSSERAKIIGGIYGTHYADAVLRELEGTDKKIDQELKAKKVDLFEVDKHISKYDYLPQMKNDIKTFEDKYARIIELTEKRGKVIKIIDRKKEIFKKIEMMEDIVNELQVLDGAKGKLSTLKVVMDRKIVIEKISKTRENIKKQGEMQRQILVKTENLQNARLKVDKLKELCKIKNDKELKVAESKALAESLDKMGNKIKAFETVINSTSKLPNALKSIKKLKELQALKLDKIKKISEFNTLTENLNVMDKKINAFKEIISSTSNLKIALDKIKRVKELQLLKVEKLKNIENSNSLVIICNKLSSKIKIAETIVNSTDNLRNTKEKLEKIKMLLDKKTKVQQILERKNEIAVEGKKYKKQKLDAIANNECLIENYKQLLQKAGKCPVCLGTIDKATVNRIIEKFSIDKNEQKIS